MTETTATETADKREFESTTCGRCGGSGHYSYCQMYGTICFRCRGAKRIYTKRGLAAKLYFEALLSKPASALEVGMKIKVGSITNGGTPFEHWATITEIEDNSVTRKHGFGVQGQPGVYEYTGFNIYTRSEKFGSGCSGAVSPTTMFRVAADAATKQEAKKKALDYQDTLTKTGTVRKVKGSPKVTPASNSL